MTQQQLQETYLGKRVRVINAETPFDAKATIVGICTFIGKNELLQKDQVTVGRMPIFLTNFNQVSLDI